MVPEIRVYMVNPNMIYPYKHSQNAARLLFSIAGAVQYNRARLAIVLQYITADQLNVNCVSHK